MRLVSSIDEAREVFDGVMLSDGNLAMHGRNARFHMALSGKEHLDWLYYIKSAVLTLGAMVSSNYPKVSLAHSKGKPYEHCALDSYTSPTLTYQCKRWYSENAKRVPDDLVIGPVVLANWLMGNGNSKWYQTNWVYCSFATHGFDLANVEKLFHKLEEAGLKHICLEEQDHKLGLKIGNIADIQKLMSMVEPYVLPSYFYKLKRPRAERPATGIYYKEDKKP